MRVDYRIAPGYVHAAVKPEPTPARSELGINSGAMPVGAVKQIGAAGHLLDALSVDDILYIECDLASYLDALNGSVDRFRVCWRSIQPGYCLLCRYRHLGFACLRCFGNLSNLVGEFKERSFAGDFLIPA